MKINKTKSTIYKESYEHDLKKIWTKFSQKIKNWNRESSPFF